MPRRKPQPSIHDEDWNELLDELKWRPPKRPKEPTSIATLMSNLMSRRGYSQSATAAERQSAWEQAVATVLRSKDSLKNMLPGDVKRGVFEIHVSHPALVQELTFQQAELLRLLKQLIPDHKIRSLKFRVGKV
jgi:hypothetical protein